MELGYLLISEIDKLALAVLHKPVSLLRIRLEYTVIGLKGCHRGDRPLSIFQRGIIFLLQLIPLFICHLRIRRSGVLVFIQIICYVPGLVIGSRRVIKNPIGVCVFILNCHPRFRLLSNQ